VLERKYRVLATEGNLNNHLGMPQTLFRLDADHQVAVVEIGTNHPGEIAYLCDILQPTHGLITNVGREHMEFFRTLDGVADAEAELWNYLREHKGTAFVNADDPHLVKRARLIQKKVTFGIAARTPNVKGRITRFDERGCATITVTPAGKKPLEIGLPVPGAHNAMNAVAAAAVGFAMRVPAKEIAAALAGFSAASKRMQVSQIAGVTILNDTYNSNPDSALAALATLKSVACSGKKIAVLADMLELGPESALLHESIGEAVARHGIDVLLTYGPLSEHTHQGATVPLKVHYDQKNILAEYLLEELSAGDAVLIKGSRGMKMEDVVIFLAERLPLKGQA
jgi:UDP-N-acetylmuramoyl-tripeptide--D-alanyl-D-alanine ligase